MTTPMSEYFKPEPRKRKAPQKVNLKSLENAALYYLQRFSSSSENFRHVMMRRVERSAKYHNTSIEEGAAMVDQLISRFTEIGLLNDLNFAKVRTIDLRRRGQSERAIRASLMKKGLSTTIINRCLEFLKCDSEDPELITSIIFCRKRGLGPFRELTDLRNRYREKDMAKLARAGFSYYIARHIIDSESKKELEEMVENSRFGQYN